MTAGLPAPEAPAPGPPRPRGRSLRAALLVGLGIHLVLATWYVFLLPLWGAVLDEPIHYGAVKYVATNWNLPRINYDLRQITDYYFIPDAAGAAQHGPTFYWPAAVLYRLTDSLTLHDQQYVLRLYSMLLGLLGVWAAWAAFALLFADDPPAVMAATALYALMPHRLLVCSVIYADSMAVLSATVALWALVAAAAAPWSTRRWLWVGVGLGFALATKASALVLVPAIAATFVLRARHERVPRRAVLAAGGALTAAVLLLAGWWFVRNVLVYHELSPTEPKPYGWGWLGLLLTADRPAWMFWYASRGLWLSTWSQVGWLPDAVARPFYGVLLLLSAVLAGSLWQGCGKGYRGEERWRLDLCAGFALTALAMYYGALQRTLLVSFHSNEQTGKHAQTLLVALIPLVALAWRQLLGPRRVAAGLTAGVVLMALFNALSLYHITCDLNPQYTLQAPFGAHLPVRSITPDLAPQLGGPRPK